MSSALATSTDILDDTAGIFYRPILKYREGQERSQQAVVSEASSSSSQKEVQRGSSSSAGAMLGASG